MTGINWNEPTGTILPENTAICARCMAMVPTVGIPRGYVDPRPFVVLLDKSYCCECYPKMVAVLEASATALLLEFISSGREIGHSAHIHAAKTAIQRFVMVKDLLCSARTPCAADATPGS